MLEGLIEYIREEYPFWSENQKKFVNETNLEIQKKIEMLKKIHALLQDDKVKEFARIIGYQEPNNNLKFLELHNSLYDFMKDCMSKVDLNMKHLKHDEYPIYCFLKSQESIISARTGRRMCDYQDLYWNLNRPGYSTGPSDSKKDGKNREKFRIKNADKIVYLPEGDSYDAFYRIQTDYVEEALKSDQATAKKMILQKYGKKNDK